MKIIEIELLNHVVIPETFHVNLKDKTDVIAIDGLNGSGKSFLINNIHPLASNRRHKDRYAIRKGKGGLKRIIYELDNHRSLEIIHEYVVNGKRHSCKSYCNIIVDGVKEELNPTGHTKKFDDLILEYLYFDNDTFTCTFLSPKAESIVNATSAKRKDILKSTMKSSKILEIAQGKNRDIITETNQTIKIYSKQMEEMYRSLPYKTLDEFDERIGTIEQTIERLNYQKTKSSIELMNYMNYIGQLESKDTSSVHTISKYIDILLDGRFQTYDTINEIMDKRDQMTIELNRIEFTHKYKQDELDNLKSKIEDACDINQLSENISKAENEISDITQFLDKEILVPYLNNDIQFKLISMLNELKGTLKRFNNDNIDIFYREDQLQEIELKNNDKLKETEKFIIEYRTYESNFDDSEKTDGIIKMVNCNTCPLYSKFVKTSVYLSDNREKYLMVLDEYDEAQKLSSIIGVYRKLYSELRDHKISLSMLSSVVTEDVSELARQTQMSSYFIDKIEDYISVITYKFNRLYTLRHDLNEYKLMLVKSKHIDINSIKDKIDILDRELTISRSKISSILNFVECVNRFNITRDNFTSISKDELKRECDILSNIKKEVQTTRESADSVKRDIVNFEREITSSQNELNNLVNKRKDLSKTSNYLLELKDRNRIHQNLKVILEKKIPLKLLKQNLDFIEMTVNSIMEENDIQLSIDIYNNEEVDEVEIAVSTRKEYVEDIALCSSGELCLLGVVLNAVLMHIIGYTIISFDEMDSNLDMVYRESFHGVINSILDKLDIEQIFCVSHNISFDMNTTHIVLGDYEVDRLHGEIIQY